MPFSCQKIAGSFFSANPHLEKIGKTLLLAVQRNLPYVSVEPYYGSTCISLGISKVAYWRKMKYSSADLIIKTLAGCAKRPPVSVNFVSYQPAGWLIELTSPKDFLLPDLISILQQADRRITPKKRRKP